MESIKLSLKSFICTYESYEVSVVHETIFFLPISLIFSVAELAACDNLKVMRQRQRNAARLTIINAWNCLLTTFLFLKDNNVLVLAEACVCGWKEL